MANKFSIKTIGLDISKKTVSLFNNLVKRKRRENIEAIAIDPFNYKLPLASNSADFVVCSHVLEHVKDDIKLIDEINRILKKDGIIFLLVPINEEHLNVPTHLRKYTSKSIIEILSPYFKILYQEENDIFSGFIRYLGVQNNPICTLLKRFLIFILSFLPFKVIYKLDKIFKSKINPSQIFLILKKFV